MSLWDAVKLAGALWLCVALGPMVLTVVLAPFVVILYAVLNGVISVLNEIEQRWLRLDRLLFRAKTR